MEDLERQKREQNVLIHGMNERPTLDGVVDEDDEERMAIVGELVNELRITGCVIKRVNRIGVRDVPDRKRPLKVEFEDVIQKEEFMRGLKKVEEHKV